MRPSLIAAPVGLAIALGGTWLAFSSRPPVIGVSTSQMESGIDFSKKDHPVTKEMLRETGLQGGKSMPAFDTADHAGKLVRIAPQDGRRPQFVMFVLDGCPCSVDAEPLFRKLAKRHGERIEFVSVTDAGTEKAREWSVRMLTRYPVVPDPEKKIIRAFDAKNSVYSALLMPGGRILKMWPGYSTDILKDMNSLMAKASGTKETPFDPEYAPKKKTSGCAF